MESLARTLVSSFPYLLAVLAALQVIPPLIRAYLRRSGPKRLKLFFFGIAFLALTFRIIARRKIITDEGIVLTGSLRTNPLVKCVYLIGCYEPTLAAYVKRKVAPGDIFLDIGANSGHFSLIAASLGADVISVEASPANCRLFSANVEANALGPKINLVNAAAGNEDGKIELHENRLNGMWSTTSSVAFWYLRPLVRKITVPLIRVEDLLKPEDFKRIGFVKIDVEGAELAVVQGLRKLLRSGRPDLEFCLEFSPSWLTQKQQEEIFSIFRSYGYEAYQLLNKEVDFPPHDIGRPKPCATLPRRQIDIVFSRANSKSIQSDVAKDETTKSPHPSMAEG